MAELLTIDGAVDNTGEGGENGGAELHLDGICC